MKRFILGFLSGLALAGLVYFGYPFILGFFGGGMPVSSEQLVPGAKDFGVLRVEVFGKGQPVADVEVDLGKIGPKGPEGPMSAIKTDAGGVALFQKVPIGTFDIFWNTNAFPQGFNQPSRIFVDISKDKTTQKRIDLAPIR